MHNTPHSEETKARLSELKKKLHASPKGVELRARMSEIRKQFYLNPENDELRKRMSENQSKAQIGRKLSAETKAKISAAHIGKTWSEKTRLKHIKRMKGTKYHLGHHHSPEAIAKIKEARARQVFTAERNLKISLGNRGKVRSPEVCLKNSLINKGRKHTPEQNERNRQAHLGQYVSEETKQKARERWASLSPTERNRLICKMWSAAMRKPNNKEKFLLSLLQDAFPNEWQYVGSGKLIINGKIPDFVNVNGKKQVIELYGDYWHKNDNPKDREKMFAKFGYETLVIWEHELDNPDKVLSKIKRVLYKESEHAVVDNDNLA